MITVGAVGASGEYDYTCDGADDHVEIIAALAAAGAGGEVHLSAGALACAASFTIPVGVSLTGETGTILQFSGDTARSIIVSGANGVADLELRGPIQAIVTGSDVHCSRLTSRQRVYGIGAFLVYAGSKTIEDVSFADCHAVDTSGFGFFMSGEGAAPTIRNVTFTGCSATNCGATHDAADPDMREWVTGFDFAEFAGLTIEGVTVIDCHASGAYESGFHCEWAPIVTNCRIERCTSTNNGRAKPSPTFAAGYALPPGWTVTDCTATGNVKGFWFSDSPARHLGVPLTVTRAAAIGNTEYGFKVNGPTATPPTLTGLTMADCVVEGSGGSGFALWMRAVSGAQISDLRADAGAVFEDGTCSDNAIAYYLAPFRASVAAPVTGETVAFTDVSENDGLTAWAWDFGDGDGSTAQHPAHAYPSPGVYPVTLAAGGNVVSQTVTVVPGVSYGGARLSEAEICPLDHDPVANATDLHNGHIGLQGSPVSRKAWAINALADDHAEIEALAALKGQRPTLNVNGTEYPGTMIRPPMLEVQLTPSAWAYQIGFVQETRHA